MRDILLSILLAIVVATSLAACGNKGPLTLPDSEEEDERRKTLSY